MLEVTNTNDEPADVELTLVGDGQVVDVTRLALGPKERLPRFYKDLAGASRTLEATIKRMTGIKDDLPADDHAYALMPERRRARVLVVTPGNTYLEATLLLDEYLDVTSVVPSKYPPSGQFDVTIFDGVAPPLAPNSGGALYLNPPEEGAPVKRGKAISMFGFDVWDKKNPILRWMVMGDIQVAQGFTLKPEKEDRVIGASGLGPLLVTGRRSGKKFVELGFDPRDSDMVLRVAWPLFVLNTINDFIEEDTSYVSSFTTGNVWNIPAPSGPEIATLEGPRWQDSQHSHQGRACGLSRGSGRLLRAHGESGAGAGDQHVRREPLEPRGKPDHAGRKARARWQASRDAGGLRSRNASRAVALSAHRGSDPLDPRVDHVPSEAHRMSPRARKILWGVFVALVGIGLFWAYQNYVLGAGVSAFKWVKDGKTYELLEPKTLGLILLAPLLLFIIGRSLADLPWQQRVIGVILRVAFIALLALGLARLARTAETSKVATVILLDVSDSVEDPSIEEAQKAVQAAIDARGSEDVVKLIAFAKRPRLVEMKEEGGKPVVPDLNELRKGTIDSLTKIGVEKPGAGSDIQAAMQLAYGVFPPGYLKRMLVMTDGVETDGDVLAEANRARGFDVKVYAIPYRRPPPGEVALRNMHVPEKVDIGQPFDVTANVYSSRTTTAKARLYQGEALNGLDGVREIDLKPGENEVKFKSIVRVGGQVTYSLKLDEIKQDKFKENNQYAATVDVPGRPTVLYVEGQPQRASYLTSALNAQQFDVDVRAPSAFPGSVKELERYDFVILSDVPHEAVSIASQDLIERYVRDLGGGFLFAGGEAGYGLGGWAHTTIERILPVRMDSQRRKDMPSVAMALVIDRSGSMTGLPIEMAKAACKATVSTLEGDDLIEVIAFDSSPVRYVKFQPARYRTRIQNEIARIQPGGGTEIFPALDVAYQDISVQQARKKHVILLTDGARPPRV